MQYDEDDGDVGDYNVDQTQYSDNNKDNMQTHTQNTHTNTHS